MEAVKLLRMFMKGQLNWLSRFGQIYSLHVEHPQEIMVLSGMKPHVWPLGCLVLGGGLHWIWNSFHTLNQHSTSVPHTDSSSRSHWTCSLNQQQAPLMGLFENRVPQNPLVNPCIIPIQSSWKWGLQAPFPDDLFGPPWLDDGADWEPPGESVLEWFLQRLGGGGPWSWSLVEPFGTFTICGWRMLRYFLIKPLIVKDHH